ncbi:DUF2332 domain-containing protein [Thermaerobacillus caldiproteolyticus]|uniref:DUF2332 domain-containing protein n=1 Tax=Thermaerobacillus caldiproteolyticus TaxID=247480 RepID=A0A7W0BZ29_9BACL|nr:DUF2332 domain-containing protein [Anoxybacillus caldiproteolyticus]MBA2876321.1 hypothetical protein [Anoxybacillus caldiproteolyticus]
MEKKIVSNRFKSFAVRECKGVSDLYEHLALNVAEDDELLEIASYARPGQSVPNLLFGAVQYLLLKGKEHELREYYGSIVKNPKDFKQSFPYFRDFCLLYRKEIISVLKNKFVQTNEVRRCAYLYPSFCFIYHLVKQPLSLIEIGTSAGLQLIWDQYCYSYGSHEKYGNINSTVHITSEIKGECRPFLLPQSPPVVSRVGIDLHINHLSNREDYLWLQALIWPEHRERMELFEQAAHCLKKQPIHLIEGDGIELLPEIARQIPENTSICIFHTHVANQIPNDAKYMLVEHIKELGKTRDVFHLYNNMWDFKLHLDYFIDGREYNEIVAETDGHARWFRWELGENKGSLEA